MTPAHLTLAAVAALAAAGAAKRGSVNRRGCTIWPINPDDYDYGAEYPGDRDVYDVMGDVDRLFREAGVRPSNAEEHYLACMDDDGVVLGGAVYGYYEQDFEGVRFTFSVVVDPKARRRGIAGDLVRELEDVARLLEDAYELPVKMVAWVVNPNMAKLLDKMGFESTAYNGEWSREDPYYEKEL